MGVNGLPKTVTRQRRGCDLNLGPSAPESSTLTNRAAEYCNERVRVSLCFYVCPRTYQALSDAFEFIGAI